MIGVAVGAMALIIVLSVFNGLEGLLRSLYGSFDPQIKVEPARGKSFESTEELVRRVKDVPGVEVVTEVIEDYAYVKYRNAEMTVILRGVQENFQEHQRLDNVLVEGKLRMKEDGLNYAIIGRGIQISLNVDTRNEFEPLQVYYVKNLRTGIIDPDKHVNRKFILPGGVFALEKNYDETYMFVPLDFAEELLDYGSKRTSFEIKVSPGFSESSVQSELKTVLGSEFIVLNSDEQHASLLRAIRIEKFFVFLIFTFILAVASFNIFFSLTMLAIEKKKDISVFFALGAPRTVIKAIFISEGAIIAFTGAALGLITGALFVFLQQQFGLISMGMESAVMLSYPVKMEPGDFLLTAVMIILITIIASYRPAMIAAKYHSKESL